MSSPDLRTFNHNLVLELYKITAREWSGTDEVNAKLGRIFRETLSRIDFERKTVHVNVDDPDPGIDDSNLDFINIADSVWHVPRCAASCFDR